MTGAEAETFLIGIAEEPLNTGLRIKIHQAQKKGHGGRITGSFVLKEAGNGTYAEALKKFIGQPFSAAKNLISEAQQIGPHAEKCTHILNCNKLRVDKNQ